jgi:hypothetical protein
VVTEWATEKPRAKLTPAIRSIVAAAEAELWVETWEREGGGSVWTVLDLAGRVLSRVVAPPDSKLLAVGSAWTLWLWRDELDVDRVRLYALERGPS